MSRLRALLKTIMLRRKKDSQLDGKPILKLPPKREEIVYAELSPDERWFYKQLEEKSQVQFSKYLREGTISKNYSNILVLLLRMRQACCHPHLNLDVDDACPVSNEDMVKLVESLDKSTVERIKAIEAFECPICFDAVQSPSFFIPCGHDSCNDCLTRLVDNAVATNLQAGDESDRAKCPVCHGIFDQKKCFTYEAFRSVHMSETVVKKSESDFEDSDGDDDSESEDEPDDEIDEKGNLRGFVVEDDEGDDLDHIKSKSKSTAEAPHATEAKGRKQKKDKKVADVKPSMLRGLRVEAAKNRGAYKRYMRYLRKMWMPAAKVMECMGLLRQIQKSGKGDCFLPVDPAPRPAASGHVPREFQGEADAVRRQHVGRGACKGGLGLPRQARRQGDAGVSSSRQRRLESDGGQQRHHGSFLESLH